MKAKIIKKKTYSFCSCGISQKLPYCDNAHRQFNAKNGTDYKSVKITSDKTVDIFVNCSKWIINKGKK